MKVDWKSLTAAILLTITLLTAGLIQLNLPEHISASTPPYNPFSPYPALDLLCEETASGNQEAHLMLIKYLKKFELHEDAAQWHHYHSNKL